MKYDRTKCKVYTHNGGKTLVLAPTALGALDVLQATYGFENYKNTRRIRRYRGPFQLLFVGEDFRRARTVSETEFVAKVSVWGEGIVYDDI